MLKWFLCKIYTEMEFQTLKSTLENKLVHIHTVWYKVINTIGVNVKYTWTDEHSSYLS